MFSRPKRAFFYAAAATAFFAAGWACNKYSNVAGISDTTVVAVVGDRQITFGDWMRQIDLLRVFAQTPIDPDNKDQVKAVLDSLIDQELVLDAAQKSHFSDSAFDEALKTKLQEADLKLKDLRDKLEKDLQTLRRVENNYQDPYKKMLLAREYANSRVGDVVVTEKDLRDWYDDYAAQALAAGQKMPPYSNLSAQIKEQKIKPAVQAEKFVKDLEDTSKVDRKQDVIDKYLASLSISEKLLGTDEGVPAAGPAPNSKDAGDKP